MLIRIISPISFFALLALAPWLVRHESTGWGKPGNGPLVMSEPKVCVPVRHCDSGCDEFPGASPLGKTSVVQR